MANLNIVSDRRVALTELPNGYRVSTVRLVSDHGFGGAPLWYETMVFKGDSCMDEDCDRYETRTEAEAGHAAMVAKWQAKED